MVCEGGDVPSIYLCHRRRRFHRMACVFLETGFLLGSK